MMTKLAIGEMLPDFVYDTPYQKGLSIHETIRMKPKTALVFLRYYGCPFCQLDMRDYALHIKEITADGGQFLVVLQSDPVRLKALLDEHPLPYPIICDPEQKLYQAFDIPAADSMESMAGPGVMEKAAKVKAAGLQHGEYEGTETQLPAVFVVNQSCTLTYVHYAQFVEDSPTAAQLQALLK